MEDNTSFDMIAARLRSQNIHVTADNVERENVAFVFWFDLVSARLGSSPHLAGSVYYDFIVTEYTLKRRNFSFFAETLVRLRGLRSRYSNGAPPEMEFATWFENIVHDKGRSNYMQGGQLAKAAAQALGFGEEFASKASELVASLASPEARQHAPYLPERRQPRKFDHQAQTIEA